jgi:NAD(P)-dependent dehydrogenase (short-subunit alcohol dehydrogenase family)
MDLGLKNKTAFITGGSIGIGLAIAKGLAKEGVNIIICARSKNKVITATEEIEKEYKVHTLGIQADVTKSEDIKHIEDEVARFGGLDILINNAGTGSNEKILDAPDEKWYYYFNLHVMAAIRLTRTLVPFMQKRGEGVILNNASICAKQPLGYEPIYNVTKSALVMFSKCLANELIEYNIRVNCINPGLVLTPDWHKTASVLGKEKGITAKEYLDQIPKENAPIGRFASPEEIADFVVFLCSSKASYSVGSTYYVDGGWLNVIT